MNAPVLRLPQALVIFLALALLAGNGSGALADERDDLAVIMDRGFVRVAVHHGPPGTVKDFATGEWSGLYPALYRAIFGTIDVEVEFVDTHWAAMIPALQSGNVDMAFLAIHPSRAATLDNSVPLLFNPMSVLVLDAEAESFAWEDFDEPGTRVAVNDGSLHEALVREMLPQATFVLAQDTAETFVQLESGRADLVVNNFIPLDRFVKVRERGAVVVPEPAVGNVNAFLFRKNNPDLRRFLDNAILYMRVNGTLNAIFRDHGLEDFLYE